MDSWFSKYHYKNYLDFRLDFSADEPNELNPLAHFVAREMSWAGQFQIGELSWAELARVLKMVSWAERAGSAHPSSSQK